MKSGLTKTIMKLTGLLTLAVLAVLAPSVLAENAPPSVPDAGATAALLAIGSAGLIASRSFFRKK